MLEKNGSVNRRDFMKSAAALGASLGVTTVARGANDRIHVRLFPVGGSPNHDMQVFWIQNGNQTWDAAKSSVVVNYTADNQWADVYIPVGQNSLWGTWGQIQQIRLDLDNGNNTGCRYHIDYIRMEY